MSNPEPDVPDPFLVDDPDDPISDEEGSADETSSEISADDIPLSHTISAPPTSTASNFPPLPASRNKDVPPPPSSDSDQYEEEAPEIYLPSLIAATMFLPIPNTDPLTTLMNKHVHAERRPARDITGEWQRHDFHTLVMTNSWRALAKMARDRIVSSDPEDIPRILGLWYLRLSSLSRLRLFNQTSAECSNLFTVLNSVEAPNARKWLFERLLPFELEVMYTRLKYWSGDHMSYLDALYAILKKSRTMSRAGKSDPNIVSMWKERGARICLIIASQLIEMKDLTAAAKILEPMCAQSDTSSPALRSATGRVYLQAGGIHMAEKHFAVVQDDPNVDSVTKIINSALIAAAKGEWSKCSDLLNGVLEQDSENYIAIHNLGVSLLCQGKLKEGIRVLEDAMKTSPSTVLTVEPFLFNISTLYELRAANSIDFKRDLLIEVAKWSGDGLRTACLKMPST